MDTKVGKNVSCIIVCIYIQRKYSTPRRFFQDIASNVFQFQGTATHKSLTVQLSKKNRKGPDPRIYRDLKKERRYFAVIERQPYDRF
jgi:hypothetical protein